MKKQFITLVCVLALFAGLLPSSRALEGEALRAADTLSTLGLTDGAEYDLTTPATRAQATVMLVKLAGAQKAAEQDIWAAGFRDTPAWAAEAINYAAHQKWVTGFTIRDFHPDYAVSANGWFTMLLRMLGYSDKAGDFVIEDAALFAQRIGLTPRAYSGSMTRGDLFESMRDALPFPFRDGRGTLLSNLVESGSCSRAVVNALGLLNESLTARQIADRHMAAVFALELYNDGLHYDAGKPTSNASGFFISPDGLAVTNYHSISGCSYAIATLSTGEAYDVKRVIYYDEDIDIAVIRVSPTSRSGKNTSAFAYLELAGTKDIRAGDEVYTLGNPLGLGLAVSSGVISDIARDVPRYALPCVMNTADISEGSSGGALLNPYGRVISVTSGAYVRGNNMYLSVPVDPVMTADLTVPGMTLKELDEMSEYDDA